VKASNMTTRRQPLDVQLWINFANKSADQEAKRLAGAEWAAFRSANYEMINIPGEPINPKGYSESERLVTIDLPPETLQRVRIFDVEQVLTWKTAAVRRIDEIGIADHSHRTIVSGLKPLKEAAAAQLIPGQPPPPDQALLQSKLSEYGLRFDRYSEVTPQARRVPVAVSLIVDQQHINRVLAAFANSNLRLVITQVAQHHFPGSVRPLALDPSIKGPSRGGFPQPFGPPGQPGQLGGEEQETNIELVIYGIVSLYERHPPRPIDPEDAAPPPPPPPPPPM
jgi:hypothetical protein